jgi:hypothetical protein
MDQRSLDSLVPFDLVPFDADQEEYMFTFHGYPTLQKIETPLTISLGGTTLLSSSISSNEVKQFKVKITSKQAKNKFTRLVQNAGNILLHDGYSKDRGSVTRQTANGDQLEFYEEDNQYFSNPRPLLSVCGACCLIKRSVIDEIGFFDPHYFMYYEDVDLSLRAWRAGWDIVYEPRSIIHHKHKATTGMITSSFFITMVEKNHLALTLVHYPLYVFVSELIRFFIRTIITVLKASMYKFRDNIERYYQWNYLAEGRIIAAASLTKHFSQMVSNKLWWARHQKRGHKEMRPYLY